ncbi:hypothetical protein BH11MYX4_BH11MYX4_45500 [soil metagenome]
MSDIQRRAAFLGAVLLIISFATGGLLAMAMTGKVSADAHGILAAHLNAMFGCFWLCALAFTLPLTRYGEVGAWRLVLLTAVPAYANWIITLVKAFLHVLGVGLNGNGSNDAVFATLNVLVVLPSFAAAIGWAYGLARKRAER